MYLDETMIRVWADFRCPCFTPTKYPLSPHSFLNQGIEPQEGMHVIGYGDDPEGNDIEAELVIEKIEEEGLWIEWWGQIVGPIIRVTYD